MSTDEDSLALIELLDEKIRELTAKMEERRELNRETHGITGDAVKARRELLDALGKYDGDLESHFRKQLDDYLSKLEKELESADKIIAERIKDVEKNIQELFGEFLGADSPSELHKVIVTGLAIQLGPDVIASIRDAVVDRLPRIVRQEMGIESIKEGGEMPGLIALTLGSKPPGPPHNDHQHKRRGK